MEPAPKKCGMCKQKAVELAVQRYETSLSHDGRSYSVTILDLEVLVCRNCQNIVVPDASEERLDIELRKAASLLMPSEIRSGREKLALTQESMARLLGIAKDTISRWETGAQIQQQGFDNYLRAFFDLKELRDYLGNVERAERSAGSPAESTSAAGDVSPVAENGKRFVSGGQLNPAGA